MQREITAITDRPPRLIDQLLEVWERSVRATHLFLSAGEVAEIKPYVPLALREVPHLMVAWRGGRTPAGFMGIDGQKLEMLFLAPEERGKGLGKKLVRYGMERFGIREVTVNEQNPQARGFYAHMGFHVCQRWELDEQGRRRDGACPVFCRPQNSINPLCRRHSGANPRCVCRIRWPP